MKKVDFFEILYLFYPLFQYGIEERRFRGREEGNERDKLEWKEI